MKTSLLFPAFRRLRLAFLLAMLGVTGLFTAPPARAGLTFTVDIIRYNHANSYRFYTPLDTNSLPAAAALGTYFIYSPFYSLQQPTNGSWREIQISTNGVNTIDGSENAYSDFNSVMQQITNGTWNMVFTNNTTTNTYTFKVSAPNMNSNMLPATIVTYPSDGSLNIPNQPTFTWQGPTDWAVYITPYVANYDYSFFQGNYVPAAQTSWTIPSPMPNGLNATFYVDYTTNSSPAVFTSTTPLASNSQPLNGWVCTNVIESGDSVAFAVTNPPVASPVLIAHYTFDNSGNLGQDSSGHGYDLTFDGGDGVASTNAAKAGGGAAYFDGNSFFSYTSSPSNVLSALAGDFSLSFWIKTTQNDGNEGGPAYFGAGIVAADVPGSAYDLVPAALDGGEIGFNTGPYDDTLNSGTDVNDGSYHHIVVTRDQETGLKEIYVDGSLNTSDYDTMYPLSDPHLLAIGCAIDASQSDPNNANPGNFFQGLLDDVQIYAGVLSSSQVSQLYAAPGSTISTSSGGHTLIAHYAFDNSGNPGLDSSGNGNDINCSSGWGPGQVFSANAIAGGGALQFLGGSSLTPCGQAFTSWTNALAGSFTVSAWLNTANVVGNDGDTLNDYDGQSIVYADNNNLGATPIALTGTKVAFRTTDPDGNDDTLHSQQSVTTGNYVHIVATRNQSTGQKKIYINGVLDSADFATTELLTGAQYVSIGGELSSPYNGLVDDVQIYSGVLSDSEVAYLYNHPGTNVANLAGSVQDFNAALGTSNLNWATSGDADWFVETTNTYNGISAAQSGSVTNNQSSTLSVTVTGPGTLTFWWSCLADNSSFDYEAYLDGDPNGGDLDDLYYNTSGYQLAGPFTIPAGTHTLSWTAFADGDNDPTEAGFLGKVSYTINTAPVITLNPFNQTNYPGYSVGLIAAASTNSVITWQWYKVGVGAIAGATSSFYSPTNTGTASVAGSYYAIVSNNAGSANTTTAAVTFVSTPLPPDWSLALKSPFYPAVSESDLTKDYYYGCIVDTNGNVYAAAEFGGNTVFGSSYYLNSGTGGDAAAIVKQSPTGAPLWAVGITNNGIGDSYGECVAPAPGGGVYLSGTYNGTNFLGTNQLTDPGNGSIFLARFDSTGSNLWVKTFGTTNASFTDINSLVADPSGNVTLAGLFGAGPLTIGSSNYNIVGQQGILLQLDQAGAVRWSQVLPTDPQHLTYNAGRIYASLNTTVTGGTTNVIIGGVSNITDRAWAVAALNATNGQAIWVRGVGAPYGTDFGNPYFANLIDDVPRVAVSGTNVFLTGVAYSSNAVFGAVSVNFGALRGEYFARYDTNGNAQLATTYGSVTTTPAAAVADANGNVYVSGSFDTFAFFGNDLLAAAANDRPYPGQFSQAFAAKFDRNGNALWARPAVSPADVTFLGIALATNGVWVSGWCLSTNNAVTDATVFGTNLVYSDAQYLEGGAGGGVSIIWNQAGVLAKITDTSVVASPVTLLNPLDNGVNFQFSFLSQAGFSHNILYRTNLVTGNWLTNSTVIGDGTLKTNSIPLSLFSPSKQGFIRVSTQ